MRRLLVLLLLAYTMIPAAWAKTDPAVIEFAFITDTHGYGASPEPRSSRASVKAFVDYCNSHPEISFAVCGGDLYNSDETDHDQAMWCLHESQRDFADLRVPIYFTRGDHDTNGKLLTPDGRRDGSQIVTNAEYYRMFSPQALSSPFYHPDGVVSDPLWPDGSYYYRDFPDQRFRLIVLNDYCLDSLDVYGYHGQQAKWLAETALDFSAKADPAAWCFLIVGHAFSINYKNNPDSRMLHAYVHGEDYRDQDCGVAFEGHYGGPRHARMVGLLCGHFHEDMYINSDGYNLVIAGRSYSTEGELGTDDEVCFDHFVLNTETRTLEQHRIGRGTSHVYSYAPPQMTEPRIAFPDLEGHGLYTRGGSGGRLIHVSSLGDDGEGTLRWACRQSGARQVVFDVAGTIRLKDTLVIASDSLSLLGQSAPAPGVTIEGAPVVIEASEVIMRHLTLRDGLRGGDFGQHHVVLAGLTVSGDVGDAIELSRTHLATVQYCRVEGAGPDCAGIVAGGSLTSYIYNHIVHCPTAIRVPSEEGCNRAVHLGRNLIEDWRDHCIVGGGMQGEVTIVGNYAQPGPQTVDRQLLEVSPDGTGRYYVRKNSMVGRPECDLDNARMVTDLAGLPYRPDVTDTARFRRMPPVARPHAIELAKSCLVASAFQHRYMFGHPSTEAVARRVRRRAGSAYRPEPVVADSLAVADVRRVEAYLNQIVAPEKSIVLFYEGDVHSAIARYSYLAGLRKTEFGDTCHVGIVSSGNFLQGGMESAFTRGQAITSIMREMGYDAIGLSEHDLDYSVDALDGILGSLRSATTCLNLSRIGADTSLFAPFIMRQYGRRRVAFVGVANPAAGLSNVFALEDGEGNLIYQISADHLYERVQQVCDSARRAGADYVVVLSSLGEKGDYPPYMSSHRLIAATTGIDVVIDSGDFDLSHAVSVADREGHPVWLTQTSAHMEDVGKLVIDPDGRLSCEIIPVDPVLYQDSRIAAMVDSLRTVLGQEGGQAVGFTQVALRKPSSTAFGPREINAGNLTADAMRYVAGTQIAWINSGSIHNEVPAGSITQGDIYNMLPFDNYLYRLRVSGKLIVKMVGNLLRHYEPFEQIFTQFSGLRVVVDPNRPLHVMRIEVFDDDAGFFTPLERDSLYTVCTTDYCFSRFTAGRLMERMRWIDKLDVRYSDAVITYIKEALGGVVRKSDDAAERIWVGDDKSIVILFENDVHCAIDSYTRMSAARNVAQRGDTAYVGLVSAGDFIQGGVAGAITRGTAIADVMHAMRYDAVAPGNHEFDYELPYVRQLLSDMDIPVTCTNLRDFEQDTLVFAPYIMQVYGHLRIAYVGVTTPTTQHSNYYSLIDGSGRHIYEFTADDVYARVQKAVDAARRDLADYVIVLSHLGEKDNYTHITSQGLIAATHGIDVVIDGHTHSIIPPHTQLNSEGRPVLIAQTGAKFQNVGRLYISPEGKIQMSLIPTETLHRTDLFIDHVLDRIHRVIDADGLIPVGRTEVNIRRALDDDIADTDLPGSRLVADAIRTAARAEVGWLNAGSLRDNVPAGKLTRSSIYSLLPYENYVCTSLLKGSIIRQAVDSMLCELPFRSGCVNLPVSGLRFTIQQADDGGIHANHIEVIDPATGHYHPLRADRLYSVASTDYCTQLFHQQWGLSPEETSYRVSTLRYSEALIRYITGPLDGVVSGQSVDRSAIISTVHGLRP